MSCVIPIQDPSDSDMAPSAMRSCQTSEPGLDCMDLNSHDFFERMCGGNELSLVTILFSFFEQVRSYPESRIRKPYNDRMGQQHCPFGESW